MYRYAPHLLFAKLNAVCPIVGLSDAPTWKFVPAAAATPAQIAAAQSILDKITPAIMDQIEASVQTAAAALPDPLATAKAQALSSLPTAQITPS